MKRHKPIRAWLAALVLIGPAGLQAALETYDFADYGATMTLTNTGPNKLIKRISLLYDSTATNTVTFFRNVTSGTNTLEMLLGSEAISGATNDVWNPTQVVGWKDGDVLKIETTDTNLNITIDSN